MKRDDALAIIELVAGRTNAVCNALMARPSEASQAAIGDWEKQRQAFLDAVMEPCDSRDVVTCIGVRQRESYRLVTSLVRELLTCDDTEVFLRNSHYAGIRSKILRALMELP